MARASTTSLTLADLALLRLRNQRLLDKKFAKPEDVVGFLGAVQSQDYHGATWAVAQRLKSPRAAVVERAFNAGKILRTHVLRPTWHFVLPADIRWMLALSAPRIRSLSAYYDRQLKIDERELARVFDVLTAALRGGQLATRAELSAALAQAGIAAKGQRMGHLLMHAELAALICSGPRRGKQHTYALLDERVPATQARTREAALRDLSLRFYTGHGPALPQDFAWWSGSNLTEAKAGLEMVRDQLSSLEIAGRTYWHAGNAKPPQLATPVVHMLPNYDEHLIAYKERSAAFDRERVREGKTDDRVFLNHLVTLNGQVIGGWRRVQNKTETTLITRLNAAERKALQAAQAELATFIEGSTPE
jgi:hypothetical protein